MSLKRKHLALAQQLSSIPVKNEGVRTLPESERESLVVEVTLQYTGWRRPLSRLLTPRSAKRYRLDGIGLRLFERIDGKKSFEQLIDDFCEEHLLSFFEGRALLMQYIEILMKRGLVVIGVPAAEKRVQARSLGP